jgi:ketosteroid isomerase-like protein
MPEAPRAIQCMIDATNAGDRDAFVDCFTEDVYLEDWGRGFHGKDGVRSWDETDNIGVGMHFDIEDARREDSVWIVTVRARSERFSGQGKMRITLDGDPSGAGDPGGQRIVRLILAE